MILCAGEDEEEDGERSSREPIALFIYHLPLINAMSKSEKKGGIIKYLAIGIVLLAAIGLAMGMKNDPGQVIDNAYEDPAAQQAADEIIGEVVQEIDDEDGMNQSSLDEFMQNDSDGVENTEETDKVEEDVFMDKYTGRSGKILWGSPEPGDTGFGYGMDQNRDGKEDFKLTHYNTPNAYINEFPSILNEGDSLTYIEYDTDGDNEPDVVEIWINEVKKATYEWDKAGTLESWLGAMDNPERWSYFAALRID